MAESRISKWMPVGTLLLGVVLGSSGLWQWKKQKLDVVSQTAALRQQQLDQYAKLVELSREYIEVQRESYRKQLASSAQVELKNRKNLILSQINFVSDNITTLESKLAQLEGREPRKLKLRLIPPRPPSNLKATAEPD